MWKLRPAIDQFYSQQLSIDHAKSLTKETEYGVVTQIVLTKCIIANPIIT